MVPNPSRFRGPIRCRRLSLVTPVSGRWGGCRPQFVVAAPDRLAVRARIPRATHSRSPRPSPKPSNPWASRGRSQRPTTGQAPRPKMGRYAHCVAICSVGAALDHRIVGLDFRPLRKNVDSWAVDSPAFRDIVEAVSGWAAGNAAAPILAGIGLSMTRVEPHQVADVLTRCCEDIGNAVVLFPTAANTTKAENPSITQSWAPSTSTTKPSTCPPTASSSSPTAPNPAAHPKTPFAYWPTGPSATTLNQPNTTTGKDDQRADETEGVLDAGKSALLRRTRFPPLPVSSTPLWALAAEHTACRVNSGLLARLGVFVAA